MSGDRLLLGAAIAIVAVAEIGLILVGRPRRPLEVMWTAVPAIAMGLLLLWAWRISGA